MGARIINDHRCWTLLTLLTLCVVLSVLSLNGCSPYSLGIMSSGYHVPVSDEYWEQLQWSIRHKQDLKTYAVWGTSPVATSIAIEVFRKRGHIMVEPTRLREILDQQQIQLTQTPGDDAQILQVGKLAGADRVLFIDASEGMEIWSRSGGLFGDYGSYPAYFPNVAVRAVDIETSEVRWSGHARVKKPRFHSNHQVLLELLTRIAIAHATCFIERGYVWIDEDTADRGGDIMGCKKIG
jgi:hypothetical protein